MTSFSPSHISFSSQLAIPLWTPPPPTIMGHRSYADNCKSHELYYQPLKGSLDLCQTIMSHQTLPSTSIGTLDFVTTTINHHKLWRVNECILYNIHLLLLFCLPQTKICTTILWQFLNNVIFHTHIMFLSFFFFFFRSIVFYQ